jgi:hypothetical protein
MKKRAVLLALVAGLVVPAAALARGHAHAATRRSAPRTFVAVFPEIGAVYVRYYCTRGRSLHFALGIHVLEEGQSGVVRFRDGRFSRNGELQPVSTVWFPYRPDRIEWLAAAAGGENGVVVGWVRVVGYSGHAATSCSAYAPPRVTIQIYPRSLDYDENSWRYLRRLIG